MKPTLAPLDVPFAQEFEGMTNVAVPLAELIETRVKLIADIKARLNEPVRQFLLSLHDGEPDFGLIGLGHTGDLPAVRWKLQKLKRDNPEKHAEQRTALAVWAG